MNEVGSMNIVQYIEQETGRDSSVVRRMINTGMVTIDGVEAELTDEIPDDASLVSERIEPRGDYIFHVKTSLSCRWVVDDCLDANGHYTIRLADGTPNGDTETQPIATVYSRIAAELIVKQHNEGSKHV